MRSKRGWNNCAALHLIWAAVTMKTAGNCWPIWNDWWRRTGVQGSVNAGPGPKWWERRSTS